MIRGDSTEYELLQKWCDRKHFLKHLEYITSCEIGVREGMGSKIILDTLKPNLHIGIDPYGNLNYQHYDHTPAYICDYTDQMYEQMVQDFKDYNNFKVFKITDIDFMNRYHHIGPFQLVHFDGPHMTKDVLREAIYFADKSAIGTRFIFDDYPKYNMKLISDVLFHWNFKILENGQNKICLERQIQS